jgi:hypothetical protein
MERDLKWRRGENQPAAAGINAGKLEHIAKKGPVGFGILGIDNDMRSIDEGLAFASTGFASGSLTAPLGIHNPCLEQTVPQTWPSFRRHIRHDRYPCGLCFLGK